MKLTACLLLVLATQTAFAQRDPLFGFLQENIMFLHDRNAVFFGRIEADYASYSGMLSGEDGIELRRLRLGVAGKIKVRNKWNYKLELDLTDISSNLSDFYIARHTSKGGTLTIGNQRVAQTLSGMTSSVSISFMERPLPVAAFGLSRRLGIGFDKRWSRGGIHFTGFGKDPNTNVGRRGYGARFFINPTRTNFNILHLGGSVTQVEMDGEIARIWARPESHVTDIRLVDTGEFTDIKDQRVWSVELAGARKAASFRGELYRAEWYRSAEPKSIFSGYYFQLAMFLTGESFHYRAGKFIRPQVLHDNGAWEVALRYSNVDLNDGSISGGEENNITLGVNWYSKYQWRIMANLIKVDTNTTSNEKDPTIVQVRAQYFF
jgi:phosphate-selective porin OprO/OprP